MLKLRVLLAEDMAHERLVIETNLKSALQPQVSVDFISVDHAEAALDRAKSFEFDLAILDIDFSHSPRSGGMNGLTLAKRIKELRPDCYAVVVSSSEEEITMVQAIESFSVDWYLRRSSISYQELAWLAKQALVSRLHREGSLLEPRLRYLANDVASRSVLRRIDAILPNQSTLIYGETGTGKELVARRIHANAKVFEPKRPLKVLDCSTLSPTLFEGEVFGHKRGAFTGAISDRIGALQLANGGDLFLDEIHNIPISLQQKLLRALNDGVFSPLGSNEEVRSNFRVIAATNVPVEESISNGRLLPDFVARIKRISVSLPPLRTRPGDIELIVHNHLALFNGFDKEFSVEALQWMKAQDWRGNTRELKAFVDTAIAEVKIPIISAPALAALTTSTKGAVEATPAENLKLTEGSLPDPGGNLEGFISKLESDYILSAVSQHGSVRAAAKSLGYSNSRLQRRIKALGLEQQLSSSSLA